MWSGKKIATVAKLSWTCTQFTSTVSQGRNLLESIHRSDVYLIGKMSDLAKEKAARLLKKRGSLSSLGSHDIKAKETAGKTKDSISTVSYIDDPGHHDDNPRPAVHMENTYQLSPTRRFPVTTVNDILKDVLASYLQEEKYEAELCRQMTKTISEVVKARVKDLMIPRYKIIVLISIGQLSDQNMRMGSRCLWDAANDTFSSHTFKNSSLFAIANVYGVYTEIIFAAIADKIKKDYTTYFTDTILNFL